MLIKLVTSRKLIHSGERNSMKFISGTDFTCPFCWKFVHGSSMLAQWNSTYVFSITLRFSVDCVVRLCSARDDRNMLKPEKGNAHYDVFYPIHYQTLSYRQ